MKRPRHELTWRAIRRRWAAPKEEVNNINGSIGNHHYKSPSAPLLDNVINGDSQFSEILNDRDKQRSDSFIEFSVPAISNIPQSHRQRDVSKEMYSLQAEIIRSELRIIISHLAFISHHIRREEKHNEESEDWKFVAMVIDRLCLILFTLSMALFTGLTLFSVPNFLKLH
jgi:hypothetical protein